MEQRLQQLQINIDQPFWEAIKANLNLLSDAKDWAEICQTQLRYKNAASDREFLKLASELLPQDTKSAECFKEWMDLLKQKTERKGKELFMPLRLALTGKEHGPEIKLLLPLLAREEIVSRLLA